MRRLLSVGDEVDLLPALTVKQPYATALCDTALESKWCENRDWRRDYPFGGLWCAIHASQEMYVPMKQLGVLLDRIQRQTKWPANHMPYQLGAVIGLVRFTACVPLAARPLDPWAVGPWCHVIDRAIMLPAPIRDVKGKLGFWKLDAETSATLRTMIPEADRAR